MSALLDALRTALGAGRVSDAAADRSRYETGWRYGKGEAMAVVWPSSPEQVATCLRICGEHGARVQPIGANTGLVGASNPDASGEQVVVSLERLNRIVEIDPVDRVAVVEGGVLLSQLNEELAPLGLMFPIDLGADPQVGGMVVTNTGGTRLLRYGDVRRNLIGVEVALPDGTLAGRLHRLRKNNTGLDFAQLFVGTSGRYGIVTRAVVQLAPRPRQTASALVAASDGTAALDLLRGLESSTGEFLTAFEVIGREALEITLRRGANLRPPFQGELPDYAVLVELSSTLDRDRLDLESLLEETLVAHAEDDPREGLVDVLVGRGEDFWSIRHQITESLREEGKVLAFDLSVPRSRLAEFSDEMRARLARSHPFVRFCDYGHWGDGGTHLNLVWDPAVVDGDPERLWGELRELVYTTCVEDFDGSFSAEHGVGPHNQMWYERFVAAPVQAVASLLAEHFDPAGMLRRRG